MNWKITESERIRRAVYKTAKPHQYKTFSRTNCKLVKGKVNQVKVLKSQRELSKFFFQFRRPISHRNSDEITVFILIISKVRNKLRTTKHIALLLETKTTSNWRYWTWKSTNNKQQHLFSNDRIESRSTVSIDTNRERSHKHRWFYQNYFFAK